MSNNGKYKITVESCILLILLIITSCIYTAKLSQSSDDINADIGKDSIVQEEKKKQDSTKKNALFNEAAYKAEGFGKYTIVIDAGHGGRDEVASSNNGRFKEKNCNLAIVKKLKRMLDQTDINVIYTRLYDRYVTKKKACYHCEWEKGGFVCKYTLQCIRQYTFKGFWYRDALCQKKR